MGLEDFLEGAAARQRAVADRLRRFGIGRGAARRSKRTVDAAAELADVHREHVAALLTAALAARVDGRPAPPEVSLDAVARLGPAVERWGLGAEVALLAALPGPENDRRLAEAVLRLAPTPQRRRLAERLDSALDEH